MQKKLLFCTVFGAGYAAVLYGAIRLCLHIFDISFFFYALLGVVGLLYAGYAMCCRLCGETGGRVLAPLIGIAAGWSVLCLAALTAGRLAAHRLMTPMWVGTGLVYLYSSVLIGVIVRRTRRQDALAAFTSIGSETGKRAVRVNQAAYVCFLLGLILPIGQLLKLPANGWLILALFLLVAADLILYTGFTASYNNRLLTEHLDPEAFYDVNVWMYNRYRKRRNQIGPLLNIRSAYYSMDQKDLARQLLERMANEPFVPVFRLQYQLACVNSCETLAEFETLQLACRGALSMVKAGSPLARQAELLLAGRHAQLEQDPEGLLWYADQLEQVKGLNNRHNHLVAALCRAEAFSLTGRSQDAAAARQPNSWNDCQPHPHRNNALRLSRPAGTCRRIFAPLLCLLLPGAGLCTAQLNHVLFCPEIKFLWF